MIIRIGDIRFIRQRYRNPNTARNVALIDFLDRRRHDLAILIRNVLIDIPGFQRFAVLIEHRKIIPLIAFAGFPASTIHCVPIRLPVEHTRTTAIRHIGKTFHNSPQTGGLSLNCAAETTDLFLIRTIAVLLAVEVLIRIAESRLNDDDILIVAGTDIIDVRRELIKRTVPERIVRKTNDIEVIDPMILDQGIEETLIERVIAAIRQMNHQLDAAIRIRVTDCLEAARHKLRERLVAIRAWQLADWPEHTALDFVADLDHFRLCTSLLEILDDFLRIVIDIFDQLLLVMLFPGFRRYLLARICPPVTVMEINQYLEAKLMGTLSQLDRTRLGRIAAATRAILRIVPDTDTDPVDAMILHDLELIHLFSINIIEFRTQFFHLRQHRYIGALNEILT